MLVPLNDNLNSFSSPPAPSFGQMLRHLSKGLKSGAGKEKFTISSPTMIRSSIEIGFILHDLSLIKFQKLLFQLNYTISAFKHHTIKFIRACPLKISFCKLPKIFSQWKMRLKRMFVGLFLIIKVSLNGYWIKTCRICATLLINLIICLIVCMYIQYT